MDSFKFSALALIAGWCAACGAEEQADRNTQSASPRHDGGAKVVEDDPSSDAPTMDDDEDSRPTVRDASAPREDAAMSAALITYAEHVRPILNRSCVPCHSPGQIAPFSLETYERAKPFASLIAKVSRDRTMPPSVIDNSGACHTFRDVPWLTEEEIATLETWHAEDAPEGDPNMAAPPVRALPKLTGDVKTIATPPYVPSTEQLDDYRCFVIESPFTEKTFVTGFDTIPGDQKTAHHMVVFYPMDDGAALIGRALDQLEPGPGYTCFGSPGTPASILAAWAPGGGATKYPDDLGIEVQPGRPLIVQMHYNTNGTAMPGEDSTRIDLEVKSEGISPAVFTQILDLDMNLPPGEEDVREIVTGTLGDQVPQKTGPIKVYGVFPHMHELGRTQKLTVDRAGTQSCMVDVPRYEFHWQRMYFYDQPLEVDSADELQVHCSFDTRTRTEVTKWGEGTQDEMCVMGVFLKL